MAIASDARIMSANANIGLNEAAFGLVVPAWGIVAMIDIMGRRQAERAVSLGTMFKAQQAHDLGLIDTLVDSPDDVPAEALAEAARWGRTVGRADTKKEIRKDMVRQHGPRGAGAPRGCGWTAKPSCCCRVPLCPACPANCQRVMQQADGFVCMCVRVRMCVPFSRPLQVAHFHATKQQDVDNFVNLVSSDRIQSALGAYIASLKK